MFYLSNGPCKLAPLRPEIHIFSRTHQFSIRQVIWEKIPKGSFDFCTFQTQLYFILARIMWKIAESSEGDLRAWRGNGAENSSECKGTEGSRERKAALIWMTPKGVHTISQLMGRKGRWPADTSPQSSDGTWLPLLPVLIYWPLPSLSLPSSLDHKTVRQSVAQHWLFIEDCSVYSLTNLFNTYLLCIFLCQAPYRMLQISRGIIHNFSPWSVHIVISDNMLGCQEHKLWNWETLDFISFTALSLLTQWTWTINPHFLISSIKLR